jgi:hypothetical protein
MQVLCSLKGAQQLSGSQVATLLSLALRSSRASELLLQLLALPATQHIDPHEVNVLLRSALMNQAVPLVEQLLDALPTSNLPASALLDHLVVLLHLQRNRATMLEANGAFQAYCRLLANTQEGLGPVQMFVLVQEMLRLPRLSSPSGVCNNIALDWLQQVLLLPQAQQLDVTSVHDLLAATLQLQPAAVEFICKLQPAQQQCEVEVHAMLCRAVTLNTHAGSTISNEALNQAVSCICQLPGAQFISPRVSGSMHA